jgi:hypothetical protein
MPIFFASPGRAAADPPGMILSAAQAAAQRRASLQIWKK